MEEQPSYKPLENEKSNENCKAIQDSVCDNLKRITNKVKTVHHIFTKNFKDIVQCP